MEANDVEPKIASTSGGAEMTINGAGFGDNINNINITLIKKHTTSRKKRSVTNTVTVKSATMNKIIAIMPRVTDGQYEIEVNRLVLCFK